MKQLKFNIMEEGMYVKVSFDKILELALTEERMKIRKHYLDVLGKPTADIMDSYICTDSEVMKMIKMM